MNLFANTLPNVVQKYRKKGRKSSNSNKRIQTIQKSKDLLVLLFQMHSVILIIRIKPKFVAIFTCFIWVHSKIGPCYIMINWSKPSKAHSWAKMCEIGHFDIETIASQAQVVPRFVKNWHCFGRKLVLELFSARRKHEGWINVCFNRKKNAHFINAGACDVAYVCFFVHICMNHKRVWDSSKRTVRTTDVMMKIVPNFKRREVGDTWTGLQGLEACVLGKKMSELVPHMSTWTFK